MSLFCLPLAASHTILARNTKRAGVLRPRDHRRSVLRWIRAVTFVAYIDTPWRFRNKSALFKYMGIGLERRTSGAAQPWVHVVPSARVCRPLKNMILAAAATLILFKQQPFYQDYRRWCDEGLTPRNARRDLARRLAGVMWGMLKSGDV